MTYIIYTKSNCHKCQIAKDLLKREQTETIYINCDEMLRLNRNEFISSMRKRTGIQEPKLIMFPLIFIDDIYLGDEGDLLNHLVYELSMEDQDF